MSDYDGIDIYCDLIIPRKIDVELVKETDLALAFHHTRPNWPVHIVVTTKEHVPSLLELDESSELARELLYLVKEVAKNIKDQKGNCRVITNLGEYQDSKHLHVHIVSGAENKS